MTRRSRNRTAPRRAVSPAVVASAVVSVALVALLALLPSAVTAWSESPGYPTSWSNGVVLCQFASSSPNVAISRSTLSGSGVTVSLVNLAEVAPNGTGVAGATLSGLSWQVENWSTDDAYDLAYLATATIVPASGPPSALGTVQLTLQFALPAYAGSPDGPTNVVSAVFSISGWAWQRSGDHLELSFGAVPSFPNAEQLSASTGSGWMLASSSTSSGTVLEQIGANAIANATAASGTNATIDANASLAAVSASSATVVVNFGDSAGAFTSLVYSAKVGIVLPSSVAGIPISEIAAVGTAGVLVSLLVAAATRRVRRRPSKLIYVTKEGEP